MTDSTHSAVDPANPEANFADLKPSHDLLSEFLEFMFLEFGAMTLADARSISERNPRDTVWLSYVRYYLASRTSFITL